MEDNDVHLIDTSDDEEEKEKQIPLRRGLDVRDLYDAKPVMLEVDTETIKNESMVDAGPNMYRYNEDNINTFNLECVDGGDDDSNLSQDEEDLNVCSPFEKLARRMENLTDDGGVKKRLFKQGDGVQIPVGSKVMVHYDAYVEYEGEPFDSTRLRNGILKIRTGACESIPGVDIAIQSMTKGEIANFLISPQYAYGEMGCPPRIPANATIYYRIEIVDYLDDQAASEFQHLTVEERENANFEQRLAATKAEILCGNRYFKQKNYKRAISIYKRGIDILLPSKLKNDNEEGQWKKILMKLYSNISKCYLKEKYYPRVVTYANKMLELQENETGFYLKGKAKCFLNDFDESRKYLEKAKRLKPNDSLINQALAELRQRRDKSAANEKAMYTRMFQQPNKKLQVSEELATKVSDFLTRFVEDKDSKEIKFCHKVEQEEIAWLTEKVQSLNLNVEISDGMVTFLK